MKYRRASGEDGFTVLELTISMAILAIVTTALAPMFSGSLVHVAWAKQRQAAATLVDQTLEQVRALPFSTVANGLDTADVTGSGDSNIAIAGSTFTYTNGETVPHGTLGYTQVPLVPHSTSTVENGTTYTIKVYPTNYQGSTSILRVSVLVSWAASYQAHLPALVKGQTLLFSDSSGCLSKTTHPFAAPCQPFLYSTAATGSGTIIVTPAPGVTGPSIGNLQLSTAQLDLPEADSAMQIEQIATVLGKVLSSGGAITTNSTLNAGDVSAIATADDDPGSSGNPSQNTSITQLNSTKTASDGATYPSTLTVTGGSTDSGSVVSAAAASASPACADLVGTAFLTGKPCGSGSFQQSGTTASMTMGLYAGSTSLGSALIGSAGAPPAATKFFTSRHVAPGGTYCPTASGDGCVHAGVQRAFGTIQLAGLPPKILTDARAPAGWGNASNNYLVQLTNYGDKVTSESGVGAIAPTATQQPASGATGPTLSYWNGSGYTSTTVNWGSAPPAITIPTVTVTDTIGGSTLTVTMTATLVAGATSTVTNTPAGCATACTASGTVVSPFNVDVVYTVTYGTTTLAAIEIKADLGTTTAKTSYRAAPSAG